MPDFEIKDLYSERVFSVKDLDGSYLINVWASWCITCRIEHSFLAKLESNNIPIIGLNYKDEKDDAINWITKFGDPYKYIIHDYYVCGRHLTNIIKVLAPLNGNNVTVEVIK